MYIILINIRFNRLFQFLFAPGVYNYRRKTTTNSVIDRITIVRLSSICLLFNCLSVYKYYIWWNVLIFLVLTINNPSDFLSFYYLYKTNVYIRNMVYSIIFQLFRYRLLWWLWKLDTREKITNQWGHLYHQNVVSSTPRHRRESNSKLLATTSYIEWNYDDDVKFVPHQHA